MFVSDFNDMEKEYLYLLLGMAGLFIALLIAAVVYYRRRLMVCKASLIRYINENIEMKQKLPESELPRFISRNELTAEEFTSIVHNMLKRLMFVSIFILAFVSTGHAQQNEPADSVYTFRFLPGSDVFYVPTFGNDKEFARLEECIETYRSKIHSGQIPLYVDGYCNSAKAESENLAVAKTRSNRVKSELIVRDGLREEHFITRNHAGKGDFVTVRLVIPRTETPVTDNDNNAETTEPTPTVKPVETAEKNEAAVEVRKTSETETAIPEATQETAGAYHFSLRANLLRWATLTPDLGVEWRVNRHIGIAVNGSWTSWTWKDNARRHSLWEVCPEVRWYIGREKRGYIGAMYKAGEFNYKLSDTGKQGNLMGGGITGGYQLKLNKVLVLDFSLGVGCIHADYEKYSVIDGMRVRQGKETKNWWGPTSAGVTLVWTIF